MNGVETLAALDRLTASWLALLDQDPRAARRLIDDVLAGGIAGVETTVSGEGVSEQQRRRCEIEIVRLAGAVDEAGYLAAFPDVAERGGDAVAHFCRRGWKKVRNPSLAFDVWWYAAEYLDPDDPRQDDLNPLVHYLVDGRFRGLLPLPEPTERLPAQLPDDRPVRRACLFASYDADGVVDQCVVDYVRELSRFADVYFLQDGPLPAAELAKLEGVARGAWAVRHGRYDFGSYSMLARDLVGWERLEEYDEVLLVNDSCYLLGPLDDVFATMSARECHWWGLQATYRPFTGGPSGDETIPMDVAARTLLHRSVFDYDEFLHIGSYFLAFRREVVADAGFRKRLDTVVEQEVRLNLIFKYETGTTQYLVGQGYSFSTFIDAVLPYHPLYGPGAWSLVDRGFPLLKRQFLARNPYDSPNLRDWKARVLAAAPDAAVEDIEANLLRSGQDDHLQRSFAITTDERGAVHVPERLTADEITELDLRTPTYDHWWAFPVCAYDHSFAGNERAVFEEVRHDPSIRKVVLTRSRAVDVDGANVLVAPIFSPEGQAAAVRCGTVFVKHSPTINLPYLRRTDAHRFINLWHGIPLKRFGLASREYMDAEHRDRISEIHRTSRAVISSSAVDRLAMAAAFHPQPIENVWLTGLPRNDMIVRAPNRLPADLAADAQRLRDEAKGRRVVMFLPTFKDAQDAAYHSFSPAEVDWLAEWCRRHDAVIALREHMNDKAQTYARLLAPLEPIDLSSRRYPNLEVLYRVADALVSDYSSCLVDFLLTGKPVISFAYDLDRYSNEERGLFYDLDQVLPGPVCRDFEQLATALDSVFLSPTPEQDEEYAWKRRLFFDHLDDGNAQRVIGRVRELALSEPSRP